jgi:hypothetical protein
MSGQANPPVLTMPVGISSIAKSGSVATIVFDQPVNLNGLPAYTTSVVGVHATAASLTGMNTLLLTFSGAITAATTLTIPFGDPAIRNASGGFAIPGTFPVT